jgi:hypothetical protein
MNKHREIRKNWKKKKSVSNKKFKRRRRKTNREFKSKRKWKKNKS